MLLAHRRTVLFTAADPYPEVGNGLVMDFAGLRTGGSRTYARNGGVRADSPTGIAGWSYSRTGELIVPDGDGLLRAVAANDPGIDPGLVTGAGLPVYEATTNKCTNYNAAPTALIALSALAAFNAVAGRPGNAGGGDANTLYGVVDDTAVISTGKLAQLYAQGKANGRAICIDNRTGAVNANISINGLTGNTNAHSVGGLVRGSGQSRVRLLGSNGVFITGGADYELTKNENQTPLNNSGQLVFEVAAGAIGYLVLNDLREKTYFDGSPVIVSGASASRGGAYPKVTGLTPGTTGVLFATINMSAIDGVSRRLVTLSDGTLNTEISLARSAANAAVVQIVAGGVALATPAITGKTGARVLSIAAFFEPDGVTLFADSVGAAKVAAAMPTTTQLDIGSRLNAASWANSPILRCGIIPGGSAALAQALSNAA